MEVVIVDFQLKKKPLWHGYDEKMRQFLRLRCVRRLFNRGGCGREEGDARKRIRPANFVNFGGGGGIDENRG